jgi:predicted nicotinamide N-methyase
MSCFIDPDPDPVRLVLDHTELVRPHLVPELRLHLVTERCPWWRSTPEELAALGVDEPFWGFAWAGGQALARHLLDHPELVRGRTVLDFGAGCGIAGLAAAHAGAAEVLAVDIDPVCEAACRLNAEANGLELRVDTRDPVGRPIEQGLVLAGDMTYDDGLTRRVLAWFERLTAAGVEVLVGDPGRGFLPSGGLEELARYDAPADNDSRGRWLRPTGVFRARAQSARTGPRALSTVSRA